MEQLIKKTPYKILGYSTYIVAQIFRYIIIILILTPFTLITGGLGGIAAVIFFDTILRLIPFNISLYDHFKKYVSDEITIYEFSEKWYQKFKYTVIVLTILFVSLILILTNIDSGVDKLFLSSVFIVLILILIPQIKYLQLIRCKYFTEQLLKTFPKLHFYKSIPSALRLKINFSTSMKNNSNLTSSRNEVGYDINSSELLSIRKTSVLNKIMNLSISTKLTSDEIIIISIILGSVCFLITGNLFGDSKYDRDYDKDIIDFNYIGAIIAFIITAGITYIFLNRTSNKTS